MNSDERTPDLLVVGGGIVGLASALEASSRGYRVAVVERGSVGGEASWAAAGMLSPLGEATSGGPMLDFGRASLSMYPDWVHEIETRSGGGVGYRKAGKIQVAMAEREVEPLRSLAHLGTSTGVSCTWLDTTDLRRLEPAVTTDALGAIYMDEDGVVDNRALGSALAEACRSAGVVVREGVRVLGIQAERATATGVVTEDGDEVAAGAVLIAAGAWSGGLEGLPRPLPVVPIRGQMLALRPALPLSRRTIGHGHVYLVPRDDGRVLVGATMEEAGFEKATTGEGLAELLDGARDLVPSLAIAPTVERWSGLRPGSRDGLPLIGADPDMAGLYYATGHFRNGILLAPVTGRVVADLIETGSSALLPDEFRPDRFQAQAPVGQDPNP